MLSAGPPTGKLQREGGRQSYYPARRACCSRSGLVFGKFVALQSAGLQPFCQFTNDIIKCVDIEFAEPNDPRIPEVNETNCFNSTELGFADIYTITTVEPHEADGDESAGTRTTPQHLGWLAMLAVAGLWASL